MIYSYKQFCKNLPQSFMGRLARALACLFLAPFVLAIGYVAVICVVGGMWLLVGLLGDPAALIPYAFIVLTFMLLWSSWEIVRSRKLYRKYMLEQVREDLEAVVLTPAGNFTKFDCKMAANALYENQPKLVV
jgi:uncharacterized membrane protein YphA (DoxX/SURF4 family)